MAGGVMRCHQSVHTRDGGHDKKNGAHLHRRRQRGDPAGPAGHHRQDESLELVGEASGGGSALEGIKALAPNVVGLDVLMPDLDGLSVLATIREKYPATRIVMITGQSTSEVVTDAQRLGIHAFVVKPFNAAKVLRAIHTALAADPDPVAESA
jgi:DNA-binding NarL/FixJ family response regulator